MSSSQTSVFPTIVPSSTILPNHLSMLHGNDAIHRQPTSGSHISGPVTLIAVTVCAVCFVIVIKLIIQRRAGRRLSQSSESDITSLPGSRNIELSTTQHYGRFLNTLRTSRHHSIHLLLTVDETSPDTVEPPPNYELAIKYNALLHSSDVPLAEQSSEPLACAAPPPPYCDAASSLPPCPSYSGIFTFDRQTAEWSPDNVDESVADSNCNRSDQRTNV